MIQRMFEDAKENAPSVIFIDDSDVIFESGQEHGLYRYLLTMLDGLESKSRAHVCVMMTAMDVGNLPPALVRSGRIELWLEMRAPRRSLRERKSSRGRSRRCPCRFARPKSRASYNVPTSSPARTSNAWPKTRSFSTRSTVLPPAPRAGPPSIS